MKPLSELDKLIQEFENEVTITKSVNSLSDTLLEKSQQQAGQLADMQQRLQDSIKAMDNSVEQINTFSRDIDRQVKQWQEATKQQLDTGLDVLTNGQKTAAQELQSFKATFQKTLEEKFENLDDRQRKFFVELADSLRVRLEDHRSELKQAMFQESALLRRDINSEMAKMNTTIQTELSWIKNELIDITQQQKKWYIITIVVAGLAALLCALVLYSIHS